MEGHKGRAPIVHVTDRGAGHDAHMWNEWCILIYSRNLIKSAAEIKFEVYFLKKRNLFSFRPAQSVLSYHLI